MLRERVVVQMVVVFQHKVQGYGSEIGIAIVVECGA